MANQADEKDFGASPISEERSSQAHQEELVMGPGLPGHGVLNLKRRRDSKGAEEQPSTSRSHDSADHDSTDSCPPPMQNSLRPFPTDGGDSSYTAVKVSVHSNSLEIERTVRANKKRRIQDDGPEDSSQYTIQYDDPSGPAKGWYLKLNDCDDADAYILEMSKSFPYSTNEPSRKKYLFNLIWAHNTPQAALLMVLGYYVALDISTSPPKNLKIVTKPPTDDGAALIHRSEYNAEYWMLFFDYKGKCYQLKVEENGVPTLEERESQDKLNPAYVWKAVLQQ